MTLQQETIDYLKRFKGNPSQYGPVLKLIATECLRDNDYTPLKQAIEALTDKQS